MAGKDLEKFIERYPTYIEALEMLEQKDQRIAELEQELAKYKDLQDRLGLENADEFEWFVMLDLLTDNEKNMHILDLHRELAEIKEKAIVPRFEYGDKVYYIKYFVGKWQVFNQEYVGENISNIIVRTMNYYSELPKDSVFATEQEAQAKLKEINKNE